MKFGFAFRIAVLIALILITGLLITGVLSLHKYERTYAELQKSRFEFVLDDTRKQIETQLDLGITLSDLQVTEKLETYIQADAQVLSIEVFDHTGSVLFSTDPSFVGDLVSEDWMQAWRIHQESGSWSLLEEEAGVVGVALHNNLSQTVGALVLSYSRRVLDQTYFENAQRLLFFSAIVAAVVVFVSLLGSMILMRNISKDLKSMSVAMDQVSKGEIEMDPKFKITTLGFATFLSTVIGAFHVVDEVVEQARILDEEEDTV